MSHDPERHEKNCLNCGTTVVGRYCHVCGQENLDPKETFWHLVSHFFNDITHFDGKFFQTLKILLFKPGFLSTEYVRGRRASYLNPIRMYVFTSAIFFLIFFSFLQLPEKFEPTLNGKPIAQIEKMDSVTFAQFTTELSDDHKPMTHQQFRQYVDTIFHSGLNFGKSDYKTRKEYDSLVASGKRRDSWFVRQLIYKSITINEKYHNNSQEIFSAYVHTLVHSTPQMLFISLPLFALILRLLYVRRRKLFYYVNHGIFGVHLYVFIFIGLLVIFSISKINEHAHAGALNTIKGFLIFWLFIYEYLAMKFFYKQGWIKTFFKFLLLNIFFVIALALLFSAFVLLSFFNV